MPGIGIGLGVGYNLDGIPLGDPNVITVIDDDGGMALVHTEGPHGLTNGTEIVISGAEDISYNGNWFVSLRGNYAFQIQFLNGELLFESFPYDTTSEGGRWDLV